MLILCFYKWSLVSTRYINYKTSRALKNKFYNYHHILNNYSINGQKKHGKYIITMLISIHYQKGISECQIKTTGVLFSYKTEQHFFLKAQTLARMNQKLGLSELYDEFIKQLLFSLCTTSNNTIPLRVHVSKLCKYMLN